MFDTGKGYRETREQKNRVYGEALQALCFIAVCEF